MVGYELFEKQVRLVQTGRLGLQVDFLAISAHVSAAEEDVAVVPVDEIICRFAN